MYEQNRNVTYIDDLLDLEDLEKPMHSHQQSSNIPDKYKKFIRNSSQLSPESGMSFYQQPPSQEFFTPPNPPKPPNHYIEEKAPSDSPTCLDVHGHIIHCPICSKFFKFDNTVYIIAIVVLAIICILLLKKVLEL